MAKDKKKKNKDKKLKSQTLAGSAARSLKGLSQNPMVADVVAAALVATAAALKDSKRAQQLAAHGADELEAMARGNAERGKAMWKLALEVGKQALETLAPGQPAKSSKSPKSAKSAKSPRSARAPKAAKAAAPKAPARGVKSGRKPK